MRKLVLLLMALFIALDGWALSFVVDSINYATMGSNAVEVVSGDYSGDITIPSSVVYSNVTYTVQEIGKDAFKDCTGLTSIEIPSTIRRFKSSAFSGCSGLTSINIPSSVTIISDFVFSGCSGLTSITIPSSVTAIGIGAFGGCSGLTSITVPSSVTSIGSRVFMSCSGLTSITIPSSVTSIGSEAFAYCSGLTSITIPTSVTSIGLGAFSSCTSLTSITIPTSVTSIGDFAFNGCTGLTSITIPTSVTIIRDATFQGCSGLTSITIPSSVTIIGDNAFAHCSGLTSITIPSSVTNIERHAFVNCTGLFTVDFNNTFYSSYEGLLFDKNKTTLIQCPISVKGNLNIPSSVTTIGELAFYGNFGITSISIPSSVISIEAGAFLGCTGLITVDSNNTNYSSKDGILYDKNLTTLIQCPVSVMGSFTIPSSVTSVGGSAFRDCAGLSSVNIPSSVESIGNYTFANCTGLITVDSNNSNYSSIEGLLYDKNQTTLIRCPISVKGNHTIPSSVTKIENDACNGCAGLISITIPSSITSFGIGAFQGCTGLTSVYSFLTLPMGLNYSDFEFNNKNCTLYVPVGTKSLYQATRGWNLFSNIIDSIVVVGSSFNVDGLTYTCTGEGSVSIKAKTTYSGTIIPSIVSYWGLKYTPNSIENGVFEHYANFSIITVPSSIKTMGKHVFNTCTNLISIELPSDLQSIGDSAFNNCTSLSSIRVKATTPPSLGTGVFSSVNKAMCVLYVPTGSLSAYKAADQWKDFLTILEYDPAGISDINRAKLSIYPNPTQTHVTIELGEASINAQLILYNLLGQTVNECQTSKDRILLDVSHFPVGTYVVRVKGVDNQKEWVGKFIKE